MKKSVYRGLTFVFTWLFLIGNLAGTALESYRSRVDDFLGTKSYDVKTDISKNQEIYKADYQNTTELIEGSKAYYEQVSAEGTVMLKNTGALPVEKGTKVTLLGLRSSDGMALYSDGEQLEQSVTLYEALTTEGFLVNPTMHDIYNTLAEDERFNPGSDAIWNDDGSVVVNYMKANIYGIAEGTEDDYKYYPAEPKISEIAEVDGGYKESIEAYNDMAIVVFGRPNVEAGDYYAGEKGIDQSTGARNPFALTTDEKDLLTFATENFEKVVVFLNTVCTFEIADLEADPEIDAIFWVGLPGSYGYTAVAGILDGSINPSGKLTDTYASNSISAPAMMNFGNYFYTNYDEMAEGRNTSADYVVYAEGIYQGYRYYETRYADCVMGKGNANSSVGAYDSTNGWNYTEEVVYPFGYGQSYTSFVQTLDSIEISDDKKTVTAKVSVTNTGTVAGKDAVQLYAQAPYYEGGVEKSAIQLLGYEKSKLLQAGETQTIEVTADLQNLASYDYENAKTYILDAGTYYFAVGNGAHDALNHILASMGYNMEDGMDAQGNAEAVKSWDYQPENGVDTTTFSVSENGTLVTNQLEDVDLNYWIPDTVTYLSRSDWAGTWPKTYEGLSIATEEMAKQLLNDTYEISHNDDTSDIVFGKDNGIMFYEMAGAEYDDPRWDLLLEQMDIQEAIQFMTYGNRFYKAIPSIGFVGATMTENGPFGFQMALSTNSKSGSSTYVSEQDENSDYYTKDGAASAVLAATFNKELQYDLGTLWGNISLFNGLPMLWGGSMNLHRTAYNARNHEYPSEDPVLTGTMWANIVDAARQKGLAVVIKHFAFNNQSSNQQGNSTFLNEQTARELELRIFQIVMEKEPLGIMTAYNRAGLTYVGAHKNLITNILKGEWGYHGYTISDWGTDYNYMSFKETVIAGTTCFDFPEMPKEWSSYVTDTTNNFENDVQMLTAIKTSVHENLYTFANTNLMNTMNESTEYVEINTWWRVLYKTIKLVSILAGLLCGAGYVYETIIKERKNKEA